jgi:hypothetical protein
MSESEFIQVAVLRYADACSQPTRLQPDCPFIELGEGGTTCRVQCRDIARHLLRVRTPARPASSFDAGMHLQVSRTQSITPSSEWHPVALVTLFARVMSSFPFVSGGHLRRTIDGTQAIGELALLGLDTQVLLGAYADEYAFGIDVATSLDLGPGEDAERATYWEGWVLLRDSISTPTVKGDLDPEFRRAVRGWARTADPESIIDRCPPKSLPTSATKDCRAQEAEYRWLITRLSETYLENWGLEALQTEYQYVTCAWQPSFVPTALLGLRSESRCAVAEALAQKLMSTDRSPKESRIHDAFTKQAINLVESGDVKGAATLLGVACDLHPDDWMLANNHGFCLIPLDPERAIAAFARAREGAPDGRAIPLVEANDALAHIRAGRPQRAAEIIGATDLGAVPQDESLLWTAEAGEFNSTLEAKQIPLHAYWVLLGDFIQRQKPSSSPSEVTGDASGP